ncbi:hypothetical protein F9L16_23485 [Agarivorans sp. B2Z047]|uniref:YdaS family helix-turn-helix protein n=1 Tax=Agarivorans sp. B2Z047 TaxID=2652721 RepID=UPI00128D46BD|nr:YdaS family helix-turn-helix protein [Agarivorans sp. B2Z047]MPW31920.1 hypothetical protein [Agarivorans sp. B2Z047]UQN44856.1 helix-turn-helix domain-containing protein [Agarivorans sp. B2Z047]
MKSNIFFEPIKRAIKIVGTQKKLAEIATKYAPGDVVIRQQAITRYLNKQLKVKDTHCIPIELATNGYVSRH